MSQAYSFGFTDALCAKIAGVTTKSMHFDVDSIFKAFDGIIPLAQELGVDAPKPRLAGFGYPHVVSLGASVEFEEEPKVFPFIHALEDIDRLKEPDDYLAAPLIQTRLKIAAELGRRRKDAGSTYIGHLYEGPITTAVLLMGQDFFTLVYDDPKRAHALLKFSTESALNYVKALHKHFNGNKPMAPGAHGICDDFAGMLPPSLFSEFVVAYWDRLYEGQQSTGRYLHSELLREDHLPFLVEAKIDHYDPSADQYLNPELLSRKCPCPFKTLIKSWEINDLTAEQLEKFYREIAGYKPFNISFSMDRIEQLDKIKRLLKVARELKG